MAWSAKRACLAVVLVILASFAAIRPADAASPFGRLDGAWVGGGRALFEGGQSERLSCNAYYKSSGGGNRLALSLRCASASSKIELRGTLNYASGQISGSWEERTFNAGGSLAGSATEKSVFLRFTGSTMGTMSVSLAGGRQSIAISSRGSALRGVSVSLGRR